MRWSRLGGNPPEILRGDLDFDAFPKLDVRRAASGVGQRDLILFVDDVFNHQLLGERADVAGLAVDLDAKVVGGTDAPLGSL